MRKTTEQMLEEERQTIGQLQKTIRIGTVSSVNQNAGTASVSWSSGTQSGEMRVLQNGTGWLPAIGDKVVSIHKTTGDGWIIGSLT